MYRDVHNTVQSQLASPVALEFNLGRWAIAAASTLFTQACAAFATRVEKMTPYSTRGSK